MPDHDIRPLEKQVIDLQAGLQKLVSKKFDKELIPIMKRPGWTTPAEFRLVAAMLAGMQAQVVQLGQLQDTVLKASKEITSNERVPVRV